MPTPSSLPLSPQTCSLRTGWLGLTIEQAEREAAKKLHYMKCPKCGLELHEISFKGVNIDKCFNCGAMVFDAGEFEMLAGQGDTNIFSSIVNVFRAKKVT